MSKENAIKDFIKKPGFKTLQVLKNNELELKELISNEWQKVNLLDFEAYTSKYHFINLYDDNFNINALGIYKKISR